VKITKLQIYVIHVPLKHAVGTSQKMISARDHVVVLIRTDEGLTGTGYTWGYNSSLTTGKCIAEILEPLLLSQDPLETEFLWDLMFKSTTQVGRKGVVLRAISAIDIALWDIKCKKVGLPLFKVLGGAQRDILVYASGGYYRGGNECQHLKEEMGRYMDKGYKAVKMKIGRLPLREDLERVRIVREIIGDDTKLMLDANGAWDEPCSAITACRAFEAFSPYWIEEPMPPDNYLASARVAAATSVPIAGGEQEYTRWGFIGAIQSGALDLIQPNATVTGGITEWMKIASLASALGVPLCPHADPYIHVHLVAAFPHAMMVEYFEPREKIKVIGDLMETVIEPSNGVIRPPTNPGIGITFDEAALERYSVWKYGGVK